MTPVKGLKRLGALALALACAALAGCGLMPEEETFAASPILRDYQREEFRLTTVERGDLVLTKKVTCTFMPVQTESLAYSVGGVEHDAIFVAVGDQVAAGQLVAQLDVVAIEAELADIDLQLTLDNLRMDALEENQALSLRRARLEQDESAENALMAEFALERQRISDDLYLLGLRRAECEARLAERQLHASFSGTVTYVRPLQDGDRSTVGEKVVTISDSTLSVFRASTEYWDRFTPGETYAITVNRRQCDAVVVTEAQLGLPESEKSPGKAAYVYLELQDTDFDLKKGDYGAIYPVLESRQNVLILPESAVSKAGGRSVVYCPDEEGMKTYKPVETGLVADRKVEILSGLSEGDVIIAE